MVSPSPSPSSRHDSDLRLQPELRSDAALRRILLTLLDTMELNESGILEDRDSEFLHDFRIAVRRSRAALGQVKKVFPRRTRRRFRDELAWLGDISGLCRDLDVYLLGFPAYQQLLPPEQRSDLAPLRAFLDRRRNQEHARLCRRLRGARYRALKQQWRRYLTSPLPKRPGAADARKPVAKVAQRRIWRAYQRVLQQGRAITPQSPAPQLHELRKTCKKLRYLMEVFTPLYPTRAIAELREILKELQDNLGEFQDLQVQTQALGEYRAQMERESGLGPQTALAIETLRKILEQNMVRARGEFETRFAAFAAKPNRRRFETLFRRDRGS